ncbi:MAG: hypothetical protein R3257_08100, partial [bacterium]|nr:hypothetical protein [bacterium]
HRKNIYREKGTYRVVSNRMATRGKTEVLLCGSPGRIRLTLLDRDRSPSNEILGRVKRGDLIRWKEWNQQDYQIAGSFRLDKSSRLSKL